MSDPGTMQATEPVRAAGRDDRPAETLAYYRAQRPAETPPGPPIPA